MAQFYVKWQELGDKESDWRQVGTNIDGAFDAALSVANRMNSDDRIMSELKAKLRSYCQAGNSALTRGADHLGSAASNIAALYAASEGKVYDNSVADTERSPLKERNRIDVSIPKDTADFMGDIDDLLDELDMDTFPAWFGPLMEFISAGLTTLDNIDRFRNPDGTLEPRWIAQSILEIAIDELAEQFLKVAGNVIIPGAGFLIGWGAKWVIDGFFELFSGQTFAQWTTDLILDNLMPGTNPEAKWASEPGLVAPNNSLR